MSFGFKYSNSIGRKLMLSFFSLLIITIIVVFVAILSINQIKREQNKLANSLIPALATVNEMTTIATDVVEQSFRMSEHESIISLNNSKDKILLLTDEFAQKYDELRVYGFDGIDVRTLSELTEKLKNNVVNRAEVTTMVITGSKDFHSNVRLMKAAVQELLDQSLLMKVERDSLLSKSVEKLSTTNLNKDNQVKLSEQIDNDIYNLEYATNLAEKLNHILKHIQVINDVNSKDNILFIEREFDHALRVVVRAIVSLKDLRIQGELVPHMQTLIKLGQDEPDVFYLKLNDINLQSNLKDIGKMNVEYLHDLNLNLNRLVSDIQSSASLNSKSLSTTINSSRLVMLILLLIAIVASLFIVWRYVYQNTVLKLQSLSSATKKILNKEYDFKIDVQGENEFSDIAIALDELKTSTREREQVNNLLRERTRRLKRSNEDLSQFAYVASHDLQEPLRMIGSYVQLLSKRYQGKIDDKADKFIGYAVEGCIRMQSLIEGLLKFSRVDSDNEEMELIDVQNMVDEVLSDLSLTIKETSAKVHCNNMSAAFASPTQIRTVFRNVINNSIKYCIDSTPIITIDSKLMSEGKVQFSISDNGIGIEERYQDKIFVIFKRLHSRNEFSGTGIGLSVCKKIVERHGGEISLTSTLGEGTKFFFTFPTSKEEIDYVN
jgi:signal transduction histidine kinase